MIAFGAQYWHPFAHGVFTLSVLVIASTGEWDYPLRPSGVAASRHTAPRHPPIRLRTTFIGKCRDTTLQESAPKVQNVANTSRFSHANLCKRLPIIVQKGA